MEMIQKKYANKEEKSTTKTRIRFIITICWALIGIGAISLVISIISVSQILAFIGLSLIFWGGILLYIKPEGYTKQVLLDTTMPSTFETLDQIINELGYRGKTIYLPPKYLKDPATYKAFLSKRQEQKPPEPKLILKQEGQLFIKNPEGILFTPPGAQLAKLFEKRLGINFSLVNLNYIKRNLPKLFIDDLELAENLEIEIKPIKSLFGTKETYGTINVRITNSLFKNIIKENPKLSQISHTIGTPISSAIACALTKALGRPVIIDDIQSYADGNITTVSYKIEKLDYTEPIEIQTQPIELPLTEKPEYRQKIQRPLAETIRPIIQTINLQKMIGLSLLIFGAITLFWISYLTWTDVFEYQKDLGLVLLTYRTTETIGLGIGMKFIHYFMLGSVFLFFGTFAYLQKVKKNIESFIRPPIVPRIIDLALIIFGALILVWATELVVYELVVWNKSLIFILLTYGSNNPIGFGIGMKVIYFFMMGLALLLSGTFTYLKRKKI